MRAVLAVFEGEKFSKWTSRASVSDQEDIMHKGWEMGDQHANVDTGVPMSQGVVLRQQGAR